MGAWDSINTGILDLNIRDVKKLARLVDTVVVFIREMKACDFQAVSRCVRRERVVASHKSHMG